MTGSEWGVIGLAMGIACLVVGRWWVRLTDVREPKYLSVWRAMR